MTNKYCNQSLSTGANDGTNFDTDAWQLLSVALDGSNVVAGDRLFVKNNVTGLGGLTLKGVAAFTTNPPEVIACKPDAPGNAGTPPTAAMILPGLRTGQSTFAYDHADAPTLTVTPAAADIFFVGYMRMYGLVIIARIILTLLV